MNSYPDFTELVRRIKELRSVAGGISLRDSVVLIRTFDTTLEAIEFLVLPREARIAVARMQVIPPTVIRDELVDIAKRYQFGDQQS